MKKLQLLSIVTLLSSTTVGFATPPDQIQNQVDETQKAHNLSIWWEKDLVEADVIINFGDTTVIDGTFLFEAHGPQAKYERADGATIFFDGETAWVSPADAEAPMGRFHVLTWPWFIIAPFKMQGEGINLNELEDLSVNGEPRIGLLQTFDDGVGDTPDDWYRVFIDPKTDRISEMSYIVTYGKDLSEANEQVSIIRYLDYSNEGGPLVSRNYEFWYWDPEAGEFSADTPKGSGVITSIRYPERKGNPFAIPKEARELLLPKQ